jgi:dTDP-4-amino-4,6-dideoxygalactose transaminase
MIRLSKPDIRDEDIARAIEVLRSGMLVQGENVLAFERKLEVFADLPHAVAVSSGTAALHLAVKALDIGPGDAVIVPAFTFPASANVIEAVGAETVLCDVDESSYVVTPELLSQRIATLHDKRLKAVMVVNEFGYPARIQELAAICRKHGLMLIEDAACALGTIADGKHPGFYGDIACFSFHPRKAITTGEGGAILTRNRELADKIVSLRNHGIVYGADGMDFKSAGLNYRLTDFQAALVLGQLDRFADELVRRRELANIYKQELDGVKSITLPDIPDGHSLQSFMVVLDAMVCRKTLIKHLLDRGIQTNLGAQALNCLTYFQQKYRVGENSCPVATQLYQSGLVLPLYGMLAVCEVQLISNTIRQKFQEVL